MQHNINGQITTQTISVDSCYKNAEAQNLLNPNLTEKKKTEINQSAVCFNHDAV